MQHRVEAGGATFVVEQLDAPGENGTHLVYAHGWGQHGDAFRPLAQSLATQGRATIIDFPGFGASPMPPGVWGTADYADAVAALLATETDRPRIWIGHSFGCRVGLQLAARHPDSVDGMILLAAAGLKRRRSVQEKLRIWPKILLFKALKLLLPEGPARDKWRQRFGSADYRMAGEMRPILTKVVNEDLSEVAARVQCPVLLIFGRDDDQTPPEMGERLARLMPNASLLVLDGFDHFSILTAGRHQVAFQTTKFLKENL